MVLPECETSREGRESVTGLPFNNYGSHEVTDRMSTPKGPGERCAATFDAVRETVSFAD